jgi:large subunit ribosomal protein L30
MAKLNIKQVKSGIGQLPAARKTLRALGLKKIGDQVTHEDNAAVRGMANRVAHLVTVEEVK